MRGPGRSEGQCGGQTFGLVLGLVAGWELGTQYLAGYLVEKSLSVDNLFVLVVIMDRRPAVPTSRRGPPGRGQRPGPHHPPGPADHHRGLLDRLVYLSTGLAIVLAFIGVKLVLHWGHTLSDAVPEIPTLTSLAVIVAILAVTTAASLAKARRDPAARAHAGSLRAQTSRPDSESPVESP